MLSKNKIKTFHIKIAKSRQAAPSPFLIDLKQSAVEEMLAIRETDQFKKPLLWRSQAKKNVAALFRHATGQLFRLQPPIWRGFKNSLTLTKKFFKTLPSPSFTTPIEMVSKPFKRTLVRFKTPLKWLGNEFCNRLILKIQQLVPIKKHKKRGRPVKKEHFDYRYLFAKLKFRRGLWDGWHHFAADLAALVILLLIIFLPLQIIFAYGRAKESETTLRTLTTSLKGNLAWASDAAQKGELGDLQQATRNIEQNFYQLKNALQKTWPLTLYPPLRSLNRLLGVGQDASEKITDVIGQVEKMENRSISPAEGLAAIRKNLNDILPRTKIARKDLQKINHGFLVPKQIKNYAAVLNKNLLAWQAQGEYLAQTLNIFPELLGQTQPKKYLILFQNNHEIRPTGGFIGSFAYLEISQGKITKWEVPGGGSYDLQGSFKERLAAPAPLTLINPRFEFQDLNWFPDFPTSAKKISDVYEKAGGQTVDGVLAVTATVAEKLLNITGPLAVTQGKIIDSQNFFTETQQAVEIDYDKTLNQPKQFIGQLFELMTERLSFSQPKEIGRVIGLTLESLQNKDIQIYLSNQDLEDQVKQLGWAGEIKDSSGDYLLVINSNIAGGKTDGAIEQKIVKETVVEADGRVISRVKIQRNHRGMPGDIWTGKRNVTYLRAYVPKGSKLLDSYGFEAPAAYLFETNDNLKADPDIRQSEFGSTLKQNGTRITEESNKTVFGNWLQLDPGQTQEAVFIYELPFRLSLNNKQPAPFTLIVQKQAGRPNDAFEHSLETTANKAVSLREISNLNNNLDLNSDKFFAFVIN
ncbi:MAG: DUF4012 domain-containing protein [bacterium]|nr:DUF4012 domain-containing protein [bacterium]